MCLWASVCVNVRECMSVCVCMFVGGCYHACRVSECCHGMYDLVMCRYCLVFCRPCEFLEVAPSSHLPEKSQHGSCVDESSSDDDGDLFRNTNHPQLLEESSSSEQTDEA